MKATNTLRVNYRRANLRNYLVLIGFLVAVIIMGIIELCSGSMSLSLKDIVEVLLGNGTKLTHQVIWKLRMPLVITAILAGMGLGISGCVMQSLLNNPLASASTIGVSQGASFGAAFAIVVLGAGSIGYNGGAGDLQIGNIYVTTICAFAGSMLVTVFVLALSRLTSIGPSEIVLVGVALSSLFSGATALMQYFASDVDLSAIVFWTFGNLSRATYTEIKLIAMVTIPSVLYFCLNAWNYNAMAVGDSCATSLGVKIERVRLAGLTLCSLCVSTIISFIGVVSFIGLVAPHIMRRVLGEDNRVLLPGSMLCGALLLLVSDLIARTVISPAVLPIGTITSFMGAPLFVYILLKGKHRK